MTTFIEELDQIILDLVHTGSMMPRGKTINADMFPEAKLAILNLVSERIIGENAGSDMSDVELVHALQTMYRWGISTGRQLESGKIKRVDDREWEMAASRLDQFEQTFTNRNRKQMRTTLYEGTKQEGKNHVHVSNKS